MATTIKQERKEASLEYLRELVSNGDTIWTTTDYVGNVGTAYVRAWVIRDGEPFSITWAISHATSQVLKERDGRWVIRTGGGGYCRSQHVVDALSWALFGKGGQLKDRDL